MIQRALAGRLRDVAGRYPVVTVTGPRQSGKTTLVRTTFPDHAYVSLESPEERRFALEDARGFLARFRGPTVIDEAQRVPDLFSYIQVEVDERDAPGRYVLSGSQNFLLLEGVSQSLAGRCAVLHLLPFSRAELCGRPPLDLDRLGREVPRAEPPVRRLEEVLHTGSYPRIHDRALPPREWLDGYVQTYLERDVRTVLHVGDLEAFGRFLRLCAGRSGQILNLSGLGGDCGVSHTTARRWLSVLEASFIVMRLGPHHRNPGKRLVRSPKLYFLDTGLLCYLLGIREPEDLHVHAARGAVFETFVLSELLKNRVHRGEPHGLSFWRDARGREIDLLVETRRGEVPLEVKSGVTVASDFFDGLDAWRRERGGTGGPGVLVYGGEEAYTRRGCVVLPWHAL